jgi:hypothetical protein
LAMVPLPAPGGPSIMSRMTSPFGKEPRERV